MWLSRLRRRTLNRCRHLYPEKLETRGRHVRHDGVISQVLRSHIWRLAATAVLIMRSTTVGTRPSGPPSGTVPSFLDEARRIVSQDEVTSEEKTHVAELVAEAYERARSGEAVAWRDWLDVVSAVGADFSSESQNKRPPSDLRGRAARLGRHAGVKGSAGVLSRVSVSLRWSRQGGIGDF